MRHSTRAFAEQQLPVFAEQDSTRGHQNLTARSPAGRQEDNRLHPGKPSLLIIGDSNVQRLEGIGSQRPGSQTFCSISGATTDHVKQHLGSAVSACDAKEVVIHVGTNDVVRKGSEEVVKDMLDLALETKGQDGVRKVYVCSITPRKDRGSFIFSRSESINNRLRHLCPKSNIVFIDLRAKLERCQFGGLARDTVHYNRAGATQALKMITESAGHFLP